MYRRWGFHFLFVYFINSFLFLRGDIYTLFDGLAYNTRGYFASCVVFFQAPQGRGKIRAIDQVICDVIAGAWGKKF